ncbi:hypothetical protein EJB05_29469, partial [Eragrostis curvula]
MAKIWNVYLVRTPECEILQLTDLCSEIHDCLLILVKLGRNRPVSHSRGETILTCVLRALEFPDVISSATVRVSWHAITC